jgi:hypothetical protein
LPDGEATGDQGEMVVGLFHGDHLPLIGAVEPGFGCPSSSPQPWPTDTRDLPAGDPRYRVLIVVTAAMGNR